MKLKLVDVAFLVLLIFSGFSGPKCCDPGRAIYYGCPCRGDTSALPGYCAETLLFWKRSKLADTSCFWFEESIKLDDLRTLPAQKVIKGWAYQPVASA